MKPEILNSVGAEGSARTFLSHTHRLPRHSPTCDFFGTGRCLSCKLSISQTKQVEILKQLKRLKKAVVKIQKSNVRFINIDGQTRSKCAIKPYVEGEFNLSDDDYMDDPIMVLDENLRQLTDIVIHKFNKLTPFQQGTFLSQKSKFGCHSGGNVASDRKRRPGTVSATPGRQLSGAILRQAILCKIFGHEVVSPK